MINLMVGAKWVILYIRPEVGFASFFNEAIISVDYSNKQQMLH